MKKIKRYFKETLRGVKVIFFPSGIYEKYIQIGYSSPGVPKGCQHIAIKAIKDIEKVMWPQWWLPNFCKRWICFLSSEFSIIRMKSKFWYNVRQKLTRGQLITDIKDKYASLRIYGYYGPEIEKIIEHAEEEYDKTCEDCGSTVGVKHTDTGWVYNLCRPCRTKLYNERKNY